MFDNEPLFPVNRNLDKVGESPAMNAIKAGTTTGHRTFMDTSGGKLIVP